MNLRRILSTQYFVMDFLEIEVEFMDETGSYHPHSFHPLHVGIAIRGAPWSKVISMHIGFFYRFANGLMTF